MYNELNNIRYYKGQEISDVLILEQDLKILEFIS